MILKQTILIYLILYLKCTHIKHKQCSSLEAIGRTSAATPIEGFLNKNKGLSMLLEKRMIAPLIKPNLAHAKH